MLRSLLIITILSLALKGNSQPGSAGSPFTSLGNAGTVSSAGTYYFNLGGTSFSTYINASGMVLVATDYGTATGNLPQVTALANTGRGILSSSVLSKLTSATIAIYTSSDGVINSSTSNSTILNRITSNATLDEGTNDITINSGWAGSGQANVQGAGANCTSSSGTTLNANLHHPCGDVTAFHWIPSGGYHTENWGNGEVASTVQFNLWVKAPTVTLPITLGYFKAALLSNSTVELDWETLTEINSNYFIVERSSDGENWAPILKLSAHGNTSSPEYYMAIDNTPNIGNNFYRLKEVDFDGNTNYSPIAKVLLANNMAGTINIYPNPTRGIAYIDGHQFGKVRVFSAVGMDITQQVKLVKINDDKYSLDFSMLSKGVYIIKGSSFLKKITVE